MSEDYERQVEESTRRLEQRWRQAQRRAARAEARLVEAQAKRGQRHRVAHLQAEVELRRAELAELTRMMQASPASTQHRGTRSYRPVPVTREGD